MCEPSTTEMMACIVFVRCRTLPVVLCPKCYHGGILLMWQVTAVTWPLAGMTWSSCDSTHPDRQAPAWADKTCADTKLAVKGKSTFFGDGRCRNFDVCPPHLAFANITKSFLQRWVWWWVWQRPPWPALTWLDFVEWDKWWAVRTPHGHVEFGHQRALLCSNRWQLH